MGQKIRPTSLRLGITREWESRWFARNFHFDAMLQEDYRIRQIIEKKIGHAGVASIVIEKTATKMVVTIRTARPGLIIGRGGKGIEELTAAIELVINTFRAKRGIKDKVALSVNIRK